jgi:flagellin
MSVINTNVKALVAQNSLTVNNRAMSKTMEQLSTGKRINSAADDAAGLAISTKMTSQIRGLNQAVRNANDGISLIQTAEGALNEITNMLQRMRQLAVQSASDSNTSSDRAALDAEFSALREEINRIGNNTQFNGMKILDKSIDGGSGTFTFQVGANSAQTVSITMGDFRTTGGTTSAITSATTTAGNQQVNTLVFASTDSLAAGDTMTITRNAGLDGTSQTYTFTAAAALADGGAIAAALAADPNISDLLGLTPATLANNGTDDAGAMSFTGASGSTYTLTANLGTVSAASYTATTQTTTLTLSGTYAAGDVISIDLGDGNAFEYTVTEANVSAITAATNNNPLATAIAGAAGIGAALGVTVAASTNTVTLTGSANQSFTASASVNKSTGGDLQMINSSTISTRANSDAAILALDSALQVVSDGRASMGATINRLNFAADNLLNVAQNASESRSRILDTDYAQATTELARSQIVQQAATAMLAQANQQPAAVLSLLQ